MCDLSEGFMLCTCSDGQPDWVLQRRDDSLPEQYLRGRSTIQTFDEDDELRILFILDGLGRGECFDFDYAPEEGDVFTFEMEDKSLSFLFEAGAWVHHRRSGLEVWAEQMQPLRNGDLALAADEIPEALMAACERRPRKRTGPDVLRDWILQEAHPHLAEWLLARLEGGKQHPARISPKLQARLERIFG